VLTDKIIFAVTLVIAAVYFYATSQIPTLEIGDPLGPKAFPRLLGIGLLLTAGVLLFEILQARKAPPPETSEVPVEKTHWLLLGSVVVWTAAYFAVFTTLGFILSTTVYLIGMTAFFNRGRWLMNVSTSVLFSLGSYLMFSKLLGVSLAQGPLPF
jgi:putative tricarboxylic transport membrane protein